jgi:beta-lactam-binding protein with PASTA domain
MTLAAATAAIEDDGFVVGDVTALPGGNADGMWIVVAQDPAPGVNRPFGSSVDLDVYDPASLATCPPP